MGEVHLAKDTRLDRKVAIKLLLAGKADRGVSPERFQSEAKAVSSLNHPQHLRAVRRRRAGRPRLPRHGVRSRAKRLRGVSRAVRCRTDQILRHAIEIADALEGAHRLAIIHRDLKPANVMLLDGSEGRDLSSRCSTSGSRNGTANELICFDVSRNDDARTTVDRCRSGGWDACNTWRPSSSKGKPVDARTDLFAFGALVLRNGDGPESFRRRPVKPPSSPQFWERIRRLDLVAAAALATRPLDRVVKKCLAQGSRRTVADGARSGRRAQMDQS